MRPVLLVTRLRHRSVGLWNGIAVASLGWLRHRCRCFARLLGWARLRHRSVGFGPISFTPLACHFVAFFFHPLYIGSKKTNIFGRIKPHRSNSCRKSSFIKFQSILNKSITSVFIIYPLSNSN